MFIPGLHIITNIEHVSEQKLTDLEACKTLLHTLIQKHTLQKIEEIWHRFENGAFTSNIALTESHICIHTWPEYGKVFFDVYLSSFQKDNREITKEISTAMEHHFGGVVQYKNLVER